MRNFLYEIIVKIRIAEGGWQSRFLSNMAAEDVLFPLFLVLFVSGAVLFGTNQHHRQQDAQNLGRQQQELAVMKEEALEQADVGVEEENKSLREMVNEIQNKNTTDRQEQEKEEKNLYAENGMLVEYASLYEKNPDVVGWLKIEDTVIDYPVMQTPEDEEYYLRRDFYGKENQNGSLLMDTDSVVGVGRKELGYEALKQPSTNLIIHGHTMKTGAMFGMLERYGKEEYGKEHRKIQFDSLYERREYELIAVFYSDIYKNNQQVFKYYQFFQAETREEFDDWYKNIKKLSLYDTGVSAEFGDEFLTLSCCAYQSDDRRFVVVGKRIK